MHKRIRLAYDRLATSDLRLSVSSRVQSVAAKCPPPPAPWFMEEQELNLPLRMLSSYRHRHRQRR
jgi:hypothetical protein